MSGFIQAIETQYKGYRFRSRLEARWAVYFDALGIKWEYEHEGFVMNGVKYLPDFWLPDFRMFAEVKPDGGDFSKAKLLAELSGKSVWCCEGTPSVRGYLVYWWPPGCCCEMNPCECSGLQEDIQFPLPDERRMFTQGFDENEKWPYSMEDSAYAGSLRDAVIAARSARFEHGENNAQKTRPIQVSVARETQYRGRLFRKRLEAQWALFFDAIGIEWVYKPKGAYVGHQGCDCHYLPDFFLPASKTWVSLEPKSISREQWTAIAIGCDWACEIPFTKDSSSTSRGILLLGGIPCLQHARFPWHPCVQHSKGIVIGAMIFNSCGPVYVTNGCYGNESQFQNESWRFQMDSWAESNPGETLRQAINKFDHKNQLRIDTLNSLFAEQSHWRTWQKRTPLPPSDQHKLVASAYYRAYVSDFD